jgi:anti-anti-sigma factor
MLVAKDTKPLTVAHPLVDRRERQPLRARELGARTVLLAVTGDIDAATASGLFDDLESQIRDYRQLVLDLSAVDFFGAAGYSLLHRLHVHCTRASIDWVVVTGTEAQRLLRVCDPDGIFPTAANIVSAVAALARGPHRTSQLGLPS